jgi:hypothetical protein
MGFLAGQLEPLGLSVKHITVERVSKRSEKILGICPNFENVQERKRIFFPKRNGQKFACEKIAKI